VPADPDLIKLGRGVRRCRKRVGLSQEELAERAGLHRNYVGLVERGERNATAAALLALARALQVPPAELWAEFSTN
jgi:transcriptional regulator with XRE-family HTH domain